MRRQIVEVSAAGQPVDRHATGQRGPPLKQIEAGGIPALTSDNASAANGLEVGASQSDIVDSEGEVDVGARPGERERWRVVNACTSRYLRLALPGQQLHLLGTDVAKDRFAFGNSDKSLGIDPAQVLHTSTGRPVQLVNNGRLIKELFV